TELLAAHGYANFGVKEIVERGGASRTAFYDCFDSKEACSDAAYERFIAVLLDRVIGSLSNRSDQDVFLVLQAYFAALQTDLVVARAFQVEMDSAGPRARDRRRGALRGLAQVLHAEQRRQALTDPELDPDVSLEAFVGSVYAVRQLASDLLDTQDHPNLEAVVPTLAVWLNNAIRRKIPE
ncbi:MAG: TetR/AcrR family transcriptional regulator, partial [Rhodococcus sp. (in: high G+C Gram-positive bacteria)]